MNPIVRLAPRGQQSDYEDLAGIEDFGTLLMILHRTLNAPSTAWPAL